MESTQAILTALENTPYLILPLAREVPPALRKRRPAARKWSVHEHVCHLAAVHPLFFARLEQMLRQENPRIAPYFPEDMGEDGYLLKVDFEEALERFVRERRKLLERLNLLSDQDWQRTAVHQEYRHYSVFIMFRHLALHDLFHSYRIEELRLKKDWEEAPAS